MENVIHKHDGMDNERINPKDLLGFPILRSIPTHYAEEGAIVLVEDSGQFYIYAMIDRTWRGAELTL